ncbi:site-specific integrase [Sphingomonas sp. CBMAI 2297]|uniref:tyrosine-type recombinase/integrase n=1 Tax=Sphingomonas sp. CBMAI 2297 TaxID=2991720 RepID=UPI0024549584|nr:site-specific integrase [Sphingomonas sp. CBMAI 2297]MDH4745889.1 site-specific integrase [Sphingomonas sp. CBMAI 2297]
MASSDKNGFITDKEELKPGLIIFRRADVQHRNWYCRVKLPKADRYKTVSLKTSDVNVARDKAFDHDADVRFRLKHDVPVFNRPFSQVADEYIVKQGQRERGGEITAERLRKVKSVINNHLNNYVGTTQVHLIGQDRWDGYPSWRRANSTKSLRDFVSDATISFEMAILGGIMNFAADKRYIGDAQRFRSRPTLKKMRRDEFTIEEYRKLHSHARSWITKATKPSIIWSRTVTYNFILIMCGTGMRPTEAKNLRWRDISQAKDREGRDMVVLFVQGKGKSRNLVAPKSVGDYLERIREISKATKPDDRVFTTITGSPNKSLYDDAISKLLEEAGLRMGASGIPRSIYCFRHTYATFRLAAGIDVYFLAEQMGTSVQMIEEHYGHVNTIKHADRVLDGMAGWDALTLEKTPATVKASKAAAKRDQAARPAPKTRNRAKGQIPSLR